jgi:hypothetical protein
MTLATHIVTGAAAARLFATHPAEAFIIGLASHYILDSVAHWDYPIRAYSSEKHAPGDTKVHFNRAIFLDIGKVLLDVLIGFAIVFFAHAQFVNGHLAFLLIAAAGAVLPDFIQFVYGVYKLPLLGLMQRFHHFMHAETHFNDRPVIGVATQVCLILLASMFF